MLTTTPLRHPEDSPYVIIRQWQVDAILALYPEAGIPIATAASALLCVFECHTSYPSANKFLGAEVEKFFVTSPVRRSVVFGKWLPYTSEYLKKCTLTRIKSNAIPEALTILESIGWITRQVPDDVRLSLKGVTTWIRLEANKINEHIDLHEKKSWTKEKPEIVVPVVAPEPKDDSGGIGQLVEELCEFHRHMMGKTDKYIYTEERKRMVMARFRSQLKMKGTVKGKASSGKMFTRDEVIGRLSQAIIGCRISPWHNGTHPGNVEGVVYDELKHIFKADEKVELMIQKAEMYGPVFREEAYEQFMGFLIGNPSKYAKNSVATDHATGVEEFSALEVNTKNRYREFARSVASFFINNHSARDVMEFAQSNTGLKKYKSGLTDPMALIFAINLAAKTYNPDGLNPEQDKAMKKFVTNFCKMQQISFDKENNDGNETQ